MKCKRSFLSYFIFFLGFSFQSNAILGANILVTVASNAGPNSFREAINISNQNGDRDTITFDLGGMAILLQTELPPITDNRGLVINGFVGNNRPTVIDCSQIPDRDTDQTILHILVDNTEIYGLEMINLNIVIDREAVEYIRIGNFSTSVDGTIIGDQDRANAFHSLRGGSDIGINFFSCIYLDNGTNTLIQNNAFGVSYDKRSIPHVEKNTSGVNVGFQFVGPVLIGGNDVSTANTFGGLAIGIFGSGTQSTIQVIGNYIGISTEDNIALPITETGIDVFMDNSSVIDNVIKNCNTGVIIGQSNNLIEDNLIEDNNTGISMGQRGAEASTGSRITSNTIRNNFTGITTLPTVSDLEIATNVIEANNIGINAGYNGDENIGHIYTANRWICNAEPIMNNDPSLAPPSPDLLSYDSDMLIGTSLPNAAVEIYLSMDCSPDVCQGSQLIAATTTDEAGEFSVFLQGLNPQGIDLTALARSTTGVIHTSEFSNCISACTVSQIDLGEDQTICEGSSLNISVTVDTDEQVLWSDGSRANDINIDQGGEYSVLVMAAAGCMAKDTIRIVQGDKLDVDILSSADQLTCDTVELDLMAVSSSNLEQLSFNWNTEDGNITTGTNGLIITLDSPGEYMLLIPSTDGYCPDTLRYEITEDMEFPSFTILEQETIDCQNEEGLLGVNWLSTTPPSIIFDWYFNDELIDNEENELIYSSIGQYILEITNMTNGCASEDSLLISSIRNCDTPQLYIPNIISPLTENINGKLTLNSNDQVKIVNSIQITDRWNNVMYRQKDILPNEVIWDGKNLQQLVTAGVYLCQIEYTVESGERISQVQDITVVY